MIVTINRTCRNHMNEEHSTHLHLRDVMSTTMIQCHMGTATAHIKQLNKVCGLRAQLVHSGLGVQLVHNAYTSQINKKKTGLFVRARTPLIHLMQLHALCANVR